MYILDEVNHALKTPNNYNGSGNSCFRYLFWHEKCMVNQMPGAADKW